jgi:hypothetical protein
VSTRLIIIAAWLVAIALVICIAIPMTPVLICRHAWHRLTYLRSARHVL